LGVVRGLYRSCRATSPPSFHLVFTTLPPPPFLLHSKLSDEELLEKLLSTEREGAVASGKDYSQRPLGYKRMLSVQAGRYRLHPPASLSGCGASLRLVFALCHVLHPWGAPAPVVLGVWVCLRCAWGVPGCAWVCLGCVGVCRGVSECGNVRVRCGEGDLSVCVCCGF
jgi:hypothetical protein